MQFDRDMESENRDLFLATRDVLLSMKGSIEVKKERISTYSDSSGSICHMRTMSYGVDVGFLKGARMIDTYNVLKGKAKLMRVLSITELNQDILKYYLAQANEINSNNKSLDD